MNILIFSPSARKVWVGPLTKILNPSYWLITYLAASVGRDFNAYVIEDSFSPVGGLKKYNGERVDVVISIGASYNPATLKVSLKEGYHLHDRAFLIGAQTKDVFNKFKPLHINLCVDVRKWFQELSEIFGGEPDIYMTEQENKWQQAGYFLNNQIWHGCDKKKPIEFFFSGGVKSRQNDFIFYTKPLRLKKIIDGGGWDKYLLPADGYMCNGFSDWHNSANRMIKSKFSFTLHEPMGHDNGWITAKYFENMGARVVNFIHRDYDRKNMYIPKDYKLRVSGPDDIQGLIDSDGYAALIEYQNGFIREEWSDLEGFYVQPFLHKIKEVVNNGR